MNRSLLFFFIYILFLFGCGFEESEFQKAKEEGTLEAFEKFLREYPNGTLQAQAEAKIRTILQDLEETTEIKIKASSSTWRQSEKPYDISFIIKEKLESKGFTIIQGSQKDTDALLEINYIEKKGRSFGNSFATNLIAKLIFTHRKFNKPIFVLNLSQFPFDHPIYAVPCPPLCNAKDLYDEAITDLLAEPFFAFFGDYIKIKIGKDKEDEFNLILKALQNEDNKIRRGATEALVKSPDVRAIQPLIESFEDQDSVIQFGAAEALGKIGTPALSPLITLLNNKNSSITSRKLAAVALRDIGDRRAVKPLITSLKDPNNQIRARSAEALGKIGDSQAVDPLIVLLKDPDADVRFKSIQALGNIGDINAVGPLIEIMDTKEASGVLRSYVVSALKDITGKDFKSSYHWEEWWRQHQK